MIRCPESLKFVVSQTRFWKQAFDQWREVDIIVPAPINNPFNDANGRDFADFRVTEREQRLKALDCVIQVIRGILDRRDYEGDEWTTLIVEPRLIGTKESPHFR